MAELHEKLAERLLKILEGERVPVLNAEGQETGEFQYITASAQELGVIAKFLKDNAITSAPEQGGALSELQERLAARKGARKLTPEDRTAAMGRLAGMADLPLQ